MPYSLDTLDPDWRRNFPVDSLEKAREYTKQIYDYGPKIVEDLPLPVKAKYLGYCRQPSAERRGEISDELVSYILDKTYSSYPEGSQEFPDLHERAVFFYISTNHAFGLINDAKSFDLPDPMGALFTDVVGRLGWSLPKIDIDTYGKLAFANVAMRVSDDAMMNYFQVRIMQMLECFYQKNSLMDTLDELEGDEHLKGPNDELAHAISYLQKYLPKQCVAPALPGKETIEWLVTEPIDSWRRVRLHPCNGIRIGMFGSLRPVVSSGTETITEGGVHFTAIKGISDKDLTIEFGVGPGGELYSMTGQAVSGYLPPEYQGKYEQLRSEALCIYHDSVVPVYVTEVVEQEVAVGRAATEMVDNRPESMVGKLRRLVLARRLVSETLKAEIIDELEHPNRDIKRQMVRHEVTGFIRPLPRGYRASPEARERCLNEMGVVLAGYGETYVKKHKRGNLENNSVGHKAAFTAGKMATANGGEAKLD